jgi:putative endonuclease
MMMNKQELGAWGEARAQSYLISQNYQILFSNWRFGKAEIDIIAQTPTNILVFIEVKTRKNKVFGNPEQAVTAKKQSLFYEAATEFMHQTQYEQEFRFDIISIVFLPNQAPEILHFQDAFFPKW